MFNSLSNEDRAIEHYDNQKAALKAIRHEVWYTYIVQYHELEADEAMNKLASPTTPIEEIPYWRAKHNCHIATLNRLDAMTI